MKRKKKRDRTVQFQTSNRRAVTVVEVLVAFVIIGLLIALILPAVFQSRKAARRLQCANHLKQITLANHEYHNAFRVFPRSYSSRLLIPLLPYLEKQALYEEYADIASYRPDTPVGGGHVFACPTDSAINVSYDQASYYLNNGTVWSLDSLNGMGVNAFVGQLKFKDVVDGQSQTAFYSERLGPRPGMPLDANFTAGQFNERGNREPNRFFWNIATPAIPGQEDAFAQACAIPANRTSVYYEQPLRSNNYLWLARLLYDHITTPNNAGCVGAGGVAVMAPATSEHTNGVNVAFVDGSVRFVASSIGKRPWQQLGTRNQND